MLGAWRGAPGGLGVWVRCEPDGGPPPAGCLYSVGSPGGNDLQTDKQTDLLSPSIAPLREPGHAGFKKWCWKKLVEMYEYYEDVIFPVIEPVWDLTVAVARRGLGTALHFRSHECFVYCTQKVILRRWSSVKSVLSAFLSVYGDLTACS